MKLRSEKLKQEVKEKCLDAFFNAVQHAQKKNTVKQILNDIFTESEKIMAGRRLLIAAKLLKGRSYEQIVREMGVGQDTVYRVKKWLGGRHKGIEAVVEKIKKTVRPKFKNKSGFRDYYPTSGLAEIRRRYRSYYWLSDLLDEINSK